MSVHSVSWRDLFSSQLFSSVLLPIVAIILTLVVAEVQGVAGFWRTAAGFVVSYVLCVILVFLMSRFYVRPMERAIRELGDKISKVSTGASSGCGDWVVDNEYLMAVERHHLTEEVWVVASNIFSDIDGGQFSEVVGENLRRGVKYRYFLRSDDLCRGQFNALRTEGRRCGGDVEVRYLNDDFFFLVDDFDLIIYNPKKDKDQEGGCSGFMGLPIERSYGRWTVEVSTRLVRSLVGRLEKLE